MAQLTLLAAQLKGLGERLEARGMAARLLHMPALQSAHLNAKLKHWQLL